MAVGATVMLAVLGRGLSVAAGEASGLLEADADKAVLAAPEGKTLGLGLATPAGELAAPGLEIGPVSGETGVSSRADVSGGDSGLAAAGARGTGASGATTRGARVSCC